MGSVRRGQKTARSVVRKTAPNKPATGADNPAEQRLEAYLAKQNPKPGPLFGSVLAKRDHYAAGANGIPYVYEGGVYVRASQLVKRRIQEIAGQAWSKHIQNEVEAWLAANSPPLDLDALGPDRINVRNGILEWNGKRWALKKHDPSYRTTVQYPVAFDPDATCEEYDGFLKSSLPEEAVRAVADEWMGYNLTSDYRFHKALMTTGESGSGKSVYLEVVAALVGHDNVASLALRELASDTFATADLYGKAANICTDIESAELRHTGLFKRLVAGEVIRGQAKHKDAFSFRNTAKLSFSANEIPSTRDTTSAFFERWLVMIFPHRFRDTPKDKRNLRKLITDSEREMSGVLNRALAGLTRLRRQGNFTTSRSAAEARAFFRQRADGFASWLIEIPPGTPERQQRDDWYWLYARWCETSGHHPLSSTRFYERARKWDGSLGVAVKATKSKGYEYFTINYGVGEGSGTDSL